MDFKIINFPNLHIASNRHVGPYEESKKAWMGLLTWASKSNVLAENTKYLGFSWDDPSMVEASKIRFDACVTVPQSVTSAENSIKIIDIPGRKYAMALHKGSYSKLADTYNPLFNWMKEQNLSFPTETPCMEVYLNDPTKTKEDDLLTEVYAPIK